MNSREIFIETMNFNTSSLTENKNYEIENTIYGI